MTDQRSLLTSNNELLDVDPGRQWEWHEAHRDLSRNQYRTSYTDMSHGREVACKSDYPSGYSGHIPNLRHDILFRNTQFDRSTALMKKDPSRDAHPSFKDQIEGIPTWCAKPQGAKKNPTYRTIPHKESTGNVRAPWGVVKPVRDVPSHRTMPSTLLRIRSDPSLRRGSGSLLASGQAALTPTNTTNMARAMQNASKGVGFSENENSFVDADQTVTAANVAAMQEPFPSTQEMLMQEMGQ
mmetsp:Transcript_89711/g.155261  ORF Transcript_89711/g.155261 Transcript_89711/m.155261 type:complete len:240 (-) Transcript_89711:130-849(-)